MCFFASKWRPAARVECSVTRIYQSGLVGCPLKSSAHYFAAAFSVLFGFPFGEQHVLPVLAVVRLTEKVRARCMWYRHSSDQIVCCGFSASPHDETAFVFVCAAA